MANDFYWIANTGSVFDSTLNWSLSSGGPPGSAIPGPADYAIFDASGTGACVLNIPIDVNGVNVKMEYPGVIVQNSTIVIGTGDASFDGGVFFGSSYDITIYGAMFLGNTAFINTSGTMTLYGDFVFEPSPPPVPPPEVLTEEFTLTALDATSKQVILSRIPSDPTQVALSVHDGFSQEYGLDYYVYGLELKWDGRSLDNPALGLATGDVIRVTYLPDTLPGKFFHHQGTFRAMATNSIFQPHGALFYNLMIDKDTTSNGYRLIDQTSYVVHNLVMASGYTPQGSDGTIYSWGDIYCHQPFGQWAANHNAHVVMNSGYPQNIFTTGGILPYLTVEKSYVSSQVKMFGDSPLYINGDFLLQDGTVNTNGLDVKVGAP